MRLSKQQCRVHNMKNIWFYIRDIIEQGGDIGYRLHGKLYRVFMDESATLYVVVKDKRLNLADKHLTDIEL